MLLGGNNHQYTDFVNLFLNASVSNVYCVICYIELCNVSNDMYTKNNSISVLHMNFRLFYFRYK